MEVRMAEAEIEFRVDPDHCVETAARKRLQELARAYLRGEAGEECGEEFELLREFLSTADFRSIRAGSEMRFRAGREVRFFLRREGGRILFGFHDDARSSPEAGFS